MKRILSAALAFMLLLSSAACGGKAKEPADSPGKGNADVQTSEPAKPGAGKTHGAVGGTTPEKPDEQPEQPEVTETGPVPLQIFLGKHYEAEWNENGAFLCGVGWNSLMLGEESAAEFPELNARLEELFDSDDEAYRTILSDFVPYAEEFLSKSDYFGGYTHNSQYIVQRADDRIFSVLAAEDEYAGGVHPNYWVNGLNLDPDTGERLELADVLTDTENIPAILTEKITEKYPDEPFADLRTMLEEYADSEFTWTMDYQGITFHFSPYEIASYAAGFLTATIWFDEMPELFAEEYTAAPTGGWAKRLHFDYDTETDLGGDEPDILYVSTMEDEYGALGLYLTLNGQYQLLGECRGYEMPVYLVCTGEDQYHLFIEGVAENDHSTLYIYDLTGDGAVFREEHFSASFEDVWAGDVGEYGLWYEAVFNDPSEFTLESLIYCLGTWVGYRIYGSGPDGMIFPQTEYYLLPGDTDPIVSAVDLEVTMLPDGKKEVIPADTDFRIRRTDGETYVEAELEDGRECRLDIIYEDWTPLINGIPEWDCFENLMYAG